LLFEIDKVSAPLIIDEPESPLVMRFYQMLHQLLIQILSFGEYIQAFVYLEVMSDYSKSDLLHHKMCCTFFLALD